MYISIDLFPILINRLDDSSLELNDIHDVFVWGNHNDTMYADVTHATVRDQRLTDVVSDMSIWDDSYVNEVRKRGWVLLSLRDNVSSVLSVARASVDVARDLFMGTNVFFYAFHAFYA